MIPTVALFAWWEVSVVLYSQMESYTHADVCIPLPPTPLLIVTPTLTLSQIQIWP